MKKRAAYLMIAGGAALWGLISLFVKGLYQFDLTALQIVTVRVIVAALILILYVLITNPSLFKIDWKDSWYFIGTGILSIVFFNWCLFTAIDVTSIPVATILLYTGPIFVTILSRFFLGEHFSTQKWVSLGLTFIGCLFVIGILPGGAIQISTFGLLVGLGSGLGYALYSIFGKVALKKYSMLTILLYTFIFSSVSLLPFSHLESRTDIFVSTGFWGYAIGIGLFSTAIAYVLYTVGLKYVESSRASITATIEPVVAMLVGLFIFDELFNLWQGVGMMLVLVAVITVQGKVRLIGRRNINKSDLKQPRTYNK